MSIVLEKGVQINLSKASPQGLSVVNFGLGWDPVKSGGKGLLGRMFSAATEEIDLDASCVMMDSSGNEIDTVWFRSPGLASSCGSVRHSGDNLTGEGDGDDEMITAQLSKMPANVKYLVLTVHSFRGQTFNEVEKASCRVLDQNNKVLCEIKLSEKGSHSGIVVGALRKENGEFIFSAYGQPAPGKTIKDALPAIRKMLGL